MRIMLAALSIVVSGEKSLSENFKKYSLWSAMMIVALTLLPTGGAKLAGVPQMHGSFAILGLPAWFGYFIGACEVAGAVGVFFRRFSIAAASGICAIMIGAIYFHLTYTPAVKGVPAIIVLLLCLFIIHRRRQASLPQSEA